MRRHLVVQRLDGGAGVPVLLGVLAREPRCHHAHLRLRLSQGDAAPEPRHHLQVVIVATLEVRPREAHRCPQQRLAAGKAEIARHDADHEIGCAVEEQPPPQHRAVAAELPLPQPIAQKHRPGRAVAVLGGGEEPPERRPDAEQREELGGHRRSREPLRLP
ncbi:MAG TPA: hypothetical protein VHQ90_16740 [Thermoanaerobaculia bacterium]|nr:hypothetical protein [Thermoanaerobaculia bacterium]